MPTSYYCIVWSIIVILVMNIIISTFNSSPESRRPHSSKSVRMYHLVSLVSFFSKQFQLPKHRFKKRHNAPFSFLGFKMFKAVKTFKPPFQIASECINQLPCFQNVLAVAKSARMHHLDSLVSNFSKQLKLPKHRFKQHQNAPFCVFAFYIFSAVLTSRTSFQIASECTILCLCF